MKSGIVIPPRGVGKRPPSTMVACGSTPRAAESKPRSSSRYAAASGFGFQNSGEFGSFQTCQSVTGVLGRSGCSRQNVPPVPYRPTAARTKSWNCAIRLPSGGYSGLGSAQVGEL